MSKKSNCTNNKKDKIVLMFPGQGSQYIGMGKDFLLKNKEFYEYFDVSSSVLGENLLDIINDRDSKGYLLDKTNYSQIAVYTLSCALNDYLFKKAIINKNNIKYIIGHSLGDYSALYSCGAYNFKKGAELVVFRGKLMASYSNNFNDTSDFKNSIGKNTEEDFSEYLKKEKMAMAAILGLDIETISHILEKYKYKVYISNHNDYFQVVISGFESYLHDACEEIKKAGAKKIIPLKVSTASHCPLMKDASLKLSKYLDDNFKDIPKLSFNFFSSTEVKVVSSSEIKKSLSRQLVNPLRWLESIENIIKSDLNNEIKSFIEVGPQKVLSGLVSRILTRMGIGNILIFNTDTLADIERIINEA